MRADLWAKAWQLIMEEPCLGTNVWTQFKWYLATILLLFAESVSLLKPNILPFYTYYMGKRGVVERQFPYEL